MGRTRTSAALLAAAAQAPVATRAAHAAAAPTPTAHAARGMRPHSAPRGSLPLSLSSGRTSVRRSWSLPLARYTRSMPPQTSCERRADCWWVFLAGRPAWLLFQAMQPPAGCACGPGGGLHAPTAVRCNLQTALHRRLAAALSRPGGRGGCLLAGDAPPIHFQKWRS